LSMTPGHKCEPERLNSLIAFLQSAEALKDTLRSGRTANGRQESTAEHSWRLCLFVMLFERELPDIDHHRLLKLCILHDLGEAISGDIPAPEQHAEDGRRDRERADFTALCSPLPADLREEFLSLYDEYADCRSREAALAKGFDKLETMLQHIAGRNDDGFDYTFNLSYGLEATSREPILMQIRALVDLKTRASLGG